ncbi:hypothetical protein PISL3812_08905 [Talaromyces islandicus]|uniref:Uncharacterized protein n=1 Tax=Talaromyces islandicus TaxID=28573 RepID=A0A0U1M9Y1_TALIS|nr:hypothetical protein PISL3812_08905 [Talaromyces islandicus]
MKLAPLVAVCLTMAAHAIMAIPVPGQEWTNSSVVSARAEAATTTRPICVGLFDECPAGTTKKWSLWNCRIWDVITDHHWKGKTYHCEGFPTDPNGYLEK